MPAVSGYFLCESNDGNGNPASFLAAARISNERGNRTANFRSDYARAALRTYTCRHAVDDKQLSLQPKVLLYALFFHVFAAHMAFSVTVVTHCRILI